MNVLILGATGMVGQGVLRECLLDPAIQSVHTLGRTPVETESPKLHQIVHPDLTNLAPISSKLTGFDACFFCIGVTAVGMPEDDYRRLTYDLTLSVARTLVALNPSMTFIYISGAGTDSTQRSSAKWARIKGETENALLRLPFKAAYMFRPGYIQPMHGIKARIWWYNAVYAVFGPLYPLWTRLAPNRLTTTEAVARAMLTAAKYGAPKPILETPDINALGHPAALN